MTLDKTQLTMLGNHIRANPDAADYLEGGSDSGNIGAIRDLYNGDVDPVFRVFLSSVSVDKVRESLEWSEVADDVKFTAQQQWMFNVLMHNGSYNPSIENNRDGLIVIFPAAMPLTRAAVLADATRHATIVEKLFAEEASGPGGGDGSASTNSAIAVFSGNVTTSQVQLALEYTL